jgi:hypothetical protein
MAAQIGRLAGYRLCDDFLVLLQAKLTGAKKDRLETSQSHSGGSFVGITGHLIVQDSRAQRLARAACRDELAAGDFTE